MELQRVQSKPKSQSSSLVKIGLGITTYNRPDYLEKSLKSVVKHLKGIADEIWVYNDGSKVDYDVVIPDQVKYHYGRVNKGVAFAKNWLIKKLLDEGCDYIFLAEDDIIVYSPSAITEYIHYSQLSGVEHFIFAHHGEANKNKLMKRVNGIDLYRNPIGAWCMYTRKVLEEVGLFDEGFVNAWEHVEHSWRIARAGYTPPWGMSVVDLTDSPLYLKEIPGSIDNSSINARGDQMVNKINGLIYWKQKWEGDFPLEHILTGLLKEEDAEYKKLGKKNPRFV